MFNWYTSALVEQYRRQDQTNKAAKERLITEIAKANNRPTRLHEHILANLGRWMMVVGCRLETRYAAMQSTGAQFTTETTPSC